MFEEMIWFADGDDPGNPPSDPAGTEPKPEPNPEPVPDQKELRNKLLRELSQEHGVNLFDAEGLSKFKEYQESQKTELQRREEALKSYQEKETAWETERRQLVAQNKAMQLGIDTDHMEDALKLADNDPERLEEVIKKYPNFRTKKGIQIGVNDPGGTGPSGQTEAEQYLSRKYRGKQYEPYIPNKK